MGKSRSLQRARSIVVGAALVAGLGLVAWGQFCVSRGWEPIAWPWVGGFDHRLDEAFNSDNTLASAIPLFLVGGLLFALLAPAAKAQRLSVARSVESGFSRVGSVAIALAVVAWIALNVLLLLNTYELWYPLLLFPGLAVISGVLLARDAQARRLAMPRFERTHLIELVLLLAMTGTFIALNIRDLESWRYVAIGDEGSFYDLAQSILRGDKANWFSQNGVFGYHPVLSSVWHAAVMRVFGSGLFGWKMASLIAIALTLPAFYWVLRETLGPRVALFGVMVLSASHYLFGYAHTSYNNVFALFPTAAAIAAAVSGAKQGSRTLLFVSGVSAGLGFYTFYSARAAIFIAIMAILTLGRPVRVSMLMPIAAGFVLMVAPLFASDRWRVISAMFDQSATEGEAPVVQQLAQNLPTSLLGFNYSGSLAHYVAGALMDEVSAVLFIAGLILVAVRMRVYGYRLVLVWFLIAVTVAGLFYPREGVAVSRLHFALPPAAGLAAIALDRAVAPLIDVMRRRVDALAATSAVLLVVAPALFALNARHFFSYSAEHYPTNVETVIIRELTSRTCRNDGLRDVVMMSGRGPDPILDGLWRFFGMEEQKPLQLSVADLDSAYRPFPQTASTGCVALAPAGLPPDIDGQLLSGGASVVTDRTGQSWVTLLFPQETAAEGRPGLRGLVQGQDRGAIRAIDAPLFEEVGDVPLVPDEPVLVVAAGEENRAYPLRVLVWHSVVNDTLAGRPVSVTYDPISGDARVFDRTVAGRTLTFEASGLLRDGNALLIDRETETLWQQLTGEAVSGALQGQRLGLLPAVVAPFGAYAQFDVDGQVLANRDDEHGAHAHNPYLHYDQPRADPIFTRAQVDRRLPAMQRVAILELEGRRMAVPFPAGPTEAQRLYEVSIGGKHLILVYDPRTKSALDTRGLPDARAVGSFAAYDVDRADRTFLPDVTTPGFFVDETGTRWSFFGLAVDGPDAGTRLQRVPSAEGFWFAVAAAFPEIEVLAP